MSSGLVVVLVQASLAISLTETPFATTGFPAEAIIPLVVMPVILYVVAATFAALPSDNPDGTSEQTDSV
jgi:predicted Na+-dependent transporter